MRVLNVLGGYVCELEKLVNKLTSKKSASNSPETNNENEGGDLLPSNGEVKENGKPPAPAVVEKKEIPTFWECIKTPMFFWEFITYFILHFR